MMITNELSFRCGRDQVYMCAGWQAGDKCVHSRGGVRGSHAHMQEELVPCADRIGRYGQH